MILSKNMLGVTIIRYCMATHGHMEINELIKIPKIPGHYLF